MTTFLVILVVAVVVTSGYLAALASERNRIRRENAEMMRRLKGDDHP